MRSGKSGTGWVPRFEPVTLAKLTVPAAIGGIGELERDERVGSGTIVARPAGQECVGQPVTDQLGEKLPQDALGIALKILSLARIVEPEEELGGVVNVVQVGFAGRAGAVEELEIQLLAPDVLERLDIGPIHQGRAIGGYVVRDELADEGPAGSSRGIVLSVRAEPGDLGSTRGPQLMEEGPIARQRGQLGKHSPIGAGGCRGRLGVMAQRRSAARSQAVVGQWGVCDGLRSHWPPAYSSNGAFIRKSTEDGRL
jgi:hypothetical protein